MSLSTLPDLALKQLLPHCDYSSVQVLRKTCRSLRNFIDDTYQCNFSGVTIKINWTKIQLTLDSSQENVDLTYQSTKKGCVVIWKEFNKFQRKHFLNGGGFMKAFMADSKVALSDGSRTVEELTIQLDLQTYPPRTEADEYLLTIVAGLEQCCLAPKRINFGALKEADLVNMFSMVSPGNLEEITIENRSSFSFPLRIRKVQQLPHWKKAKTLKIRSFVADLGSIEKHGHFTEVEMRVKETSVEFLLDLKKLFLTSLSPKCFKISVTFMDRQNFEIFGTPFMDTDRMPRRYFKSSATNLIFMVERWNPVVFKHISRNEVPDGAVMNVE